MTGSFTDNGFTVGQTSTGVTITPSGASTITVTIPDFSSMGIDFSNASTFHEYVDTVEVMPASYISSESLIWNQLLRQPAPLVIGEAPPDGPVTNGSTSHVAILGDVTHYVDSTDDIVTNVTQTDHLLNPGAVVRYLYESDGAYYITTIGVGNGPLGALNQALSSWVWDGNTADIGRAAIYADANGGSAGAGSTNGSLVCMPETVPAWLSAETSAFSAAPFASPLVLDLNGDGVNLTALGSSGATYFDMNESGFKVATGWVGPNDGLLCIDKNSDGIINDRGELFGDQAGVTNGFAALAVYDTNSNGHITSADTQFGDLRVWVDANGDGISQAGELHTLSSLGITDISLSYSGSSSTIEGNSIEQTGTFTIGGNTHTIDDVWFALDNVNSVYNGDYTLNAETLFLPDLRGYGTLPELNIAMSQDSTLLGMVGDLAGKTAAQLLDGSYDLKGALTDILYQWAGVESVDPASRGNGFDAQKLEFLEQLNGQGFSHSGNPDVSSSYAPIVAELQTAWDAAFSHLAASLLGQIGLGDLYQNPTYDPTTDLFSGSSWQNQLSIHFGNSGADSLYGDSSNDIFIGGTGADSLHGGTGDDTYVFTSGFGNAVIHENLSEGNDAIHFSGIDPSDIRMWTDAYGNLYLQDTADPSHSITVDAPTSAYGSTDSTVGQYVEQVTFDSSYATTWDLTGGLHLTGDNSGDNLYGTAYADTLTGGSGNDTIYGNAGNDTIIGGAGNNQLYGSTGDDTYAFTSGFGNAVIHENLSEGNDTIHFSGIDPSDIRMWTDAYGNLYLQDTADLSHSITVDAPTSAYGSTDSMVGQYVEQVTFDSSYATTWDLTGGLSLTADNSGDYLYGTAYADTITGGSGTDNLYGNGGNDTIIGGAGNDHLYGGTDDDTYVFTSGFGNAVIHENLSEGNDTIHFSGIDPNNIHMWTDAYGNLYLQDTADLLHSITVTGSVTGYGSTESTVGQYVEQVTFDSSYATTWDLTGGLHLTGDNSGDYLYGTAYGDTITGGSGNDHIYGNDGDDVLIGGAGNNHLDGGAGNNTDDYSDAAASVAVDLSSGTASDNGAGGSDTLTNIQNVTGSTHDDTITGDSNDNILYGAGGNDILTGGGGADSFVFKGATAFTGSSAITDFNTSQGDKIDIADVLQGHYNPLTDAIANFVQLTTSGSNTLLKIDLDGTGSSHTPTTIATLDGITGLSLSTLITDHHLIIPT